MKTLYNPTLSCLNENIIENTKKSNLIDTQTQLPETSIITNIS
jgi:hypothetical protein